MQKISSIAWYFRPVMWWTTHRKNKNKNKMKWNETRHVFCKQNGTSRLIFESDLSRSPELKLIMPSNPRPMSPYTCSIVTCAISLGHPVFQEMTLIWPFKVNKGQTDFFILFATYDLLSVFYSNYSAISHGNPVSQQMTLIWPSKVTKGQTDFTILFVTYDFL